MVPDKKYWFKRRRFGYGWTPVTWQGWLLMIVFLAVAIVSAIIIFPGKSQRPTTNETLLFLAITVVDLAVFLKITLAKSPAPKWRWGKHSGDKPHEDF